MIKTAFYGLIRVKNKNEVHTYDAIDKNIAFTYFKEIARLRLGELLKVLTLEELLNT